MLPRKTARRDGAPRHIPRKRFGQHFLHDPKVIERIVATIDPKRGQPLVEIGPGLGAITLPLLKIAGEMDAVEIDRDAIRALAAAAEPVGKLRIHEADALSFDFTPLASQGERLRLVGNLPYNISTPLLFHLLDQRMSFVDMHFMLQKEVVDRMAAQPDDDHYGRLTVMLAPWFEVTALFDVGPGAFKPPPKVYSSIVRLRPHASPPFPMNALPEYAHVVKAAFAQRRKTLRNALRVLLSAEAIAASGVDPGARAETVSPALYSSLADTLAAQKAARL
jgi:16S rRNA (adenine1518-N6/adenine1519-N6)-dimethyltransferase